MRTGIATWMLLGWAAVAAAQPPLGPPPEPVGPPLTAAESILLPGGGTGVGHQHVVGVQLQFGRPTGTRLQYAVYRGGDYTVLAEVFGGAKAAFWGDEAVVGVGGRASFNLLSDGVNDALVLSPGVGVAYWQARPHPADSSPASVYYNPYTGSYFPAPPTREQTDRYFIHLDTNLGWLHDLSPNLGWELGINFGVRVGLSGDERGGKPVSGKVNGGTVGVYTGFRY